MRVISLNSIPIRNEDIVFRKIEDEYILVPLRASSDEVDNIFNLNKVGADVWERIDGKKTVKEIIDELVQEYELEPIKIKEDVLVFLDDLAHEKIIGLEDEGS